MCMLRQLRFCAERHKEYLISGPLGEIRRDAVPILTQGAFLREFLVIHHSLQKRPYQPTLSLLFLFIRPPRTQSAHARMPDRAALLIGLHCEVVDLEHPESRRQVRPPESKESSPAPRITYCLIPCLTPSSRLSSACRARLRVRGGPETMPNISSELPITVTLQSHIVPT